MNLLIKDNGLRHWWQKLRLLLAEILQQRLENIKLIANMKKYLHIL